MKDPLRTNKHLIQALDMLCQRFADKRARGLCPEDVELLPFPEVIYPEEIQRLYVAIEQYIAEQTYELAMTNEILRREIAERKRAEDALRAQQEMLQTIFDHIPVMVDFIDADGRLQFLNPAWERILGWSIEDILTNNLNILAESYPDAHDYQRALDFIAAATGEWADFKTRVRDGRVIDTAWANIRLSNGTIVGIGQDITERKRAEVELKERETQVLNAQRLAQLGSWECDVATGVLTWSDEMYAIWGLTRRPEPLTLTEAMQYIQPDDRAKMRALVAQTERTQGSYTAEYRVIRPDGSIRTVQSIGAAVADASGRAVRLFGTTQDITERKQVEAERENLSRQLLQTQEAERRAIARELHDEIGQRLTGLCLLLITTQQLPLNQAQARLTDALALVRDLMEQVRRLALDLRPAILDDFGLRAALVWLFDRYTTQTQVDVRFEQLESEEQQFAPEVATAAYRIVQEALTNVARHAGVSVVTVRLWTDDDTLFVVVADQGCGFDPQTIHHGTSTGLAGMRERAALLGGELTIESAIGEGTRLTTAVPLRNHAVQRL